MQETRGRGSLTGGSQRDRGGWEKRRVGCEQRCKDGRSGLTWGFLGGEEWELGWEGLSTGLGCGVCLIL